jgi:Cu+-exporting ATPase
MALEPETVFEPAGAEPENPELSAMRRRFWTSAGLTVPVVGLAMFGMPLAERWGHEPLAWVELALSTPVVLWGGWPFFERGYRSLVTRELNMFTLIALGTAAAFGFSVLALLAPGLLPHASHGGELPVYFEASSVIVTLVLLGQVLELRARQATSGAIAALLGLSPKTARRVEADGEHDVPLEQIAVGDRLRVRPARCSKARARSTNRRSPASRSRAKNPRAAPSPAAR